MGYRSGGRSRRTIDRQLGADGVEVIGVPAKLAARVRLLSAAHGRKIDEADAISVGIAALTADRLNTAAIEASIVAMRALVEHREDLFSHSATGYLTQIGAA